MAEVTEKKTTSVTADPSAVTSAGTAAGAAGAATTTENVVTTTSTPAYADPARVKAIEDMYAAQLNSQKEGLKTAFDKNMSTLEENRADIAKTYATQQNQAAVDFERQRRNFLETASANGLNIGAGSQAQLSMNAANQKARSGLLASEAETTAKADKSIADLKIQYQNDINSAVAENDYKKAAALLDEYTTAYNQAITKAQQQAQFGVFDGYADIYGEDTARQMQEVWALQNPVIAYSLGQISAEKYKTITGEYPPGYSTGGGGGGTGRYYGPGTDGDDGNDDGVSLNEIPSVGSMSVYEQNKQDMEKNGSFVPTNTRTSVPAGTDRRPSASGILPSTSKTTTPKTSAVPAGTNRRPSGYGIL